MDINLTDLLNIFNYQQALIITLAIFGADFVSGLIASLRSGRRIKSSIMHQTLTKKSQSFFYYIMVGLAFFVASYFTEDHNFLMNIGSIITIIPAVPELISIFENVRIMKTGVDTKPKTEEKEDSQ